MIFLYFFCSGSIKIFGGLICVQRFYNLILKTLMSLFLVQSLKERQWWMKIMLWILWLISSWQWPYFFPSETLIFFWPCIGLKKFFFGTVLYQLLIKYYQTVIAQKLALWFNTWRREATGEKRISPPFWLLKNLGYLIIVFFFFSPRFKGKNMEENYTDGKKFEWEESLVGVKWATICLSSSWIFFVTKRFLWGAWLSAWSLCCILEVATANTRCLH